MKIWLINPYGPIPGERWRAYRFTILGEALAERGHDVIWWTANFAHHFKQYRSRNWKDIHVSRNFVIRLVPTYSYSKNIGLKRVIFEIVFGWRMYDRALKEQSPDCIVASLPDPLTGYLQTKLINKYNIPLIVDFVDLYPEVFRMAFPSCLRHFASVVISPLYLFRKCYLRQATALTAVCDTYRMVAEQIAPRLRLDSSITAFIGADILEIRSRMCSNEAKDSNAWRATKMAFDVWAVYAGSLGNNYDIETLLSSSVLLQERASRVKIIIAGEGPMRDRVSEFAKTQSLTTLKYLGGLDSEELSQLYDLCDIGLCPYVAETTVVMPVKIYDYLASGLPIVNSLPGELENLLREQQIGIQYESGNPVSLADALEYLASHEDLRRLMANGSYKAAMQFDQHVQYGRFVEFIERVMTNKKRI